jgi:hypothetical protein
VRRVSEGASDWQVRILKMYHCLLVEYGVPSIPICFSPNPDEFLDIKDQTIYTCNGTFGGDDETGEIFFLFPFYRTLASDYLKGRGLRPLSEPSDDFTPEQVMGHEFYHFLKFLTCGHPDEEVIQSENDADDFAKSYA